MIKLHFNLETGDYRTEGAAQVSETALLRAMIARVTPNILKNPVKWISINIVGDSSQISASPEFIDLKEHEVKIRMNGLVENLKRDGVTPF